MPTSLITQSIGQNVTLISAAVAIQLLNVAIYLEKIFFVSLVQIFHSE